ncbi:hypothetical protein [Roseovarius bejariae]|nr:hypothetical protein [Roseovarius bejariae]
MSSFVDHGVTDCPVIFVGDMGQVGYRPEHPMQMILSLDEMTAAA